jgi:hypothetical protein
MSVAIAVFVKTPGFSPIKTRLAADIGARSALRCYQLSVIAVRRAILAARAQRPVLLPYWAVAEPAALERWRGWPTLAQFGDELGARMRGIFRTLVERHDAALLIGGDVPAIAADALVAAVDALHDPAPRRVIARAQDGGFGLFGANRPIEGDWSAVEYGAPDTAERFLAKVGAELPLSELPPVVDLDTLGDAYALLYSDLPEAWRGALRRRLLSAR